MSSDVQICNRGLSWVGLSRITALTGAEPEAKQCKLHYADTLAMMLSSFPWTFAISRVTMAKLINDRTNEWLFRYQRPINSLRIEWVNDPAVARAQIMLGQIASAPYEASGDDVYSDVDNAVCEFTTLITDASILPPYFQYALAWAIGRDVVISLTEENKRWTMAEQKAADALDAAMAADAALQPHHDEQYPAHIVERGATPFQQHGYNQEIPYRRRS